MLDSAVRVS